MLRFGAPMVRGMMAMWILRVSDRFFLQHYSSTAEVGLYAMAVRFAMILEMLVYVPFNNNWPAVFFRVANQKNAKIEFSSLFTYFFLLFCFFALAISIFSRPAIQIMTTPAYHDSVRAVPLLILSSLFLGIYTNVTVGFSITGKTEYHALTVLLAAATNVALNFLLIPQYGMLGAATASVCAFGVKMLVGYMLAMRLYPIPYNFLRLIRIAAAFGLPFILHEVIIPGSLPLEIIFDLGLLAGYLGLLVALGFFSPQERAWARAQVARIRNGLMALRSVEYERSNA
jgi:O-antigen/teichoic acid export membrane protein